MVIAAAVLALVAFSNPASASLIVDGATYTLSFTDGGDADPTTFHITYTIDTTTYTGAGTLLGDVAFKIAAAGDIESATVTAMPAGYTFFGPGKFDSGGCGTGTAGFICFDFTDPGGLPIAGGPYTFEADVDLTSADAFFDGTLEASIKALYGDPCTDGTGCVNGFRFRNQLSQHITQNDEGGPGGDETVGGSAEAPAPGAAVLLGLGLAAFAVAGRLRRK
jgi:hypothetical protein